MIARLTWRFRRLQAVLQRLRISVALRGWRGTLLRVSQEFKHRPQTDETLHLLPLEQPFQPFALPTSPTPLVSVIVPVYGKLDYTLACLHSIALHGAQTTFEVIVVDDASPDDCADTFAQIGGLRLIRNTRNLGFIGSSNVGAAAARGEYLMFLNNDTQVTPRWLDALLGCFGERADCGIAGSRLVYPDGRLQEAGALVFADGSCWNVGRFEDRDEARYAYRRETDYVSGAALMLPKQLFDRLGGFDTRYTPAYYEDADLAFAVRHAGLRVYYEPASTVIHCEGISSGTDLLTGIKRYQLINQEKFAQKWAVELGRQAAPGTTLEQALHWRRRGTVLVVDAMAPDVTRDSGSLRLCAILRLLDDQGWQACFAPDDGRVSSSERAALGALGCEVLARPDTSDLPRWLRRHGAQLHAVMLCRHGVARQYASLVRRHAPQAKLLFDTVDLHFLREQRAAQLTGNATIRRQAKASQRSELSLINHCDVTFVVSPHEQSLLQTLAPAARVELLSNIHPVHGCGLQHGQRKDLVFIGGFGHPPNADAVRWLARVLVPQLRRELPDMIVHVLGDIPHAQRRELATEGLQLHGRVPDLGPWLDTCLASLAPLRFGAGVKGKINMAMSYGVPVVATAVAVEGMQLSHEENALVAEEAADFVTAIQRLIDDPDLWQRLSNGGLENVREHFSMEAAAATLHHVLD